MHPHMITLATAFRKKAFSVCAYCVRALAPWTIKFRTRLLWIFQCFSNTRPLHSFISHFFTLTKKARSNHTNLQKIGHLRTNLKDSWFQPSFWNLVSKRSIYLPYTNNFSTYYLWGDNFSNMYNYRRWSFAWTVLTHCLQILPSLSLWNYFYFFIRGPINFITFSLHSSLDKATRRKNSFPT